LQPCEDSEISAVLNRDSAVSHERVAVEN